MKKFSFALQGVLDIRTKFEEQAKMNYAVAQAKLNAEEAKLEALFDKLNAYEEALAELYMDNLDLLKIRQYSDGIDVIKENIEEQKLVIKRAENQVELARKRLNAAVLDRKTIDKLKERALDEYIKEYNAEEMAQVNEIVSYRHSVSEDKM